MEAKSPVDIGGSQIDRTDPFALTEHIRYLVRHEHIFADFQNDLERVLNDTSAGAQSVYEDFVALLRRYRDVLDKGSPEAGNLKAKVESFDAHLPPATAR